MAQIATFDDLVDLSDRDLQRVLQMTDHYTLAIALQGAPPALRDAAMGILPAPAATRVADEVATTGAMTRAEIDRARAFMLTTVAHLAEHHEIDVTVVAPSSAPAGGALPADYDRVAFNAGYTAGWTAAVRHKGAGLSRSQAHLDSALASLRSSARDRHHAQIAAFRCLGDLDDRSLARLFTHIRHDTLAHALIGTDEDFREQVYAHMSAHAAGEICDDIAHLGPMRADDVEVARSEIGAAINAGLADGSLFRRGGSR